MQQWVVYDDEGVIFSGDYDEAVDVHREQVDFTGDLVLAKIEAVRR